MNWRHEGGVFRVQIGISSRTESIGCSSKDCHGHTDMNLSVRKLDKMIKEATVDCYDELEQASGFFTMIEDHLAVPFATEVLGVEVSVVGVEMDDNGSLKAACERNGKRQLIGLIDLELPKSPPSGAEWIAAYRHWLGGR